MVMIKSITVDVWEVIAEVLETHEPIVVLAFFGHFYFHLHPSRLATMLDEETDTIIAWLRKVQTDIKRAYRDTGGKLEGADDNYLNGRTISTSTSLIYEDDSQTVDGDELEE